MGSLRVKSGPFTQTPKHRKWHCQIYRSHVQFKMSPGVHVWKSPILRRFSTMPLNFYFLKYHNHCTSLYYAVSAPAAAPSHGRSPLAGRHHEVTTLGTSTCKFITCFLSGNFFPWIERLRAPCSACTTPVTTAHCSFTWDGNGGGSNSCGAWRSFCKTDFSIFFLKILDWFSVCPVTFGFLTITQSTQSTESTQ